MDDLQEALVEALPEGLIVSEGGNTDGEYATVQGQRSAEIKLEMSQKSNNADLLLFFEDADGEEVAPRNFEGYVALEMIPMDKVVFHGTQETQIRKEDLNVVSLQQSVENIDQINPIHVVPFGEGIVNEQGNLDYDRYIVVSGRRRYEALAGMGKTAILALVDTTIPIEFIDFYQGISQNSKPLTFSEKLTYVNRIHLNYKHLSLEALESFYGYASGEFLKSLYIDQMKVDYPDIFSQVERGKLSIEQGYTRIEKEIAKAEKLLAENGGEMNQDDIEESLRGKSVDELSELAIDVHKQSVDDRQILPANLRRTIEARDSGTCQCCGFGEGESDFMGLFNVHHMVAVQYQGSDAKTNLILLCERCHKAVHKYEMGDFTPDLEVLAKYDWVKKVVVLGNILQSQRKKAFKLLAKKDPNMHRVVQKGAKGLGKAIKESGVQLNGEAEFGGSPYQAFLDATADIANGGGLKGSLSKMELYIDDEGNDVLPIDKDLPEPLNDNKIEVIAGKPYNPKPVEEQPLDVPEIEQAEEHETDTSYFEAEPVEVVVEEPIIEDSIAEPVEDVKEDSNIEINIPEESVTEDSTEDSTENDFATTLDSESSTLDYKPEVNIVENPVTDDDLGDIFNDEEDDYVTPEPTLENAEIKERMSSTPVEVGGSVEFEESTKLDNSTETIESEQQDEDTQEILGNVKDLIAKYKMEH